MTPKYENAGGSKFGVTLRASALLTQHPPRGPGLMGRGREGDTTYSTPQ